MPLSTNTLGKKDAKKATQTAVSKASASAEATVEPVNKNLGTLADTIGLVGVLRNPADLDHLNVKGSNESVSYGRIVGYTIKNFGTEDIKYTHIVPASATDRLACGEKSERVLKAGETAEFSNPSLAALLAKEEFNGRATGGDHKVRARYSAARSRKADAELDAVAEYHFALNPIQTEGADDWRLQDLPGKDVLTVNEDKSKTINPGFEDWHVFAEVKRRVSSKGSAKSKVEQRAKGATAFLKSLGETQSVKG